MSEEFVTISVLGFLESMGLKILAYDYPQSGTGISIHPNRREKKTKNLGMITPDIIAVKDCKIIFFENKPDFCETDVDKLVEIKKGNYSKNIYARFPKCRNFDVLTAIAFGCSSKSIYDSLRRSKDLDFIMCVTDDGSIQVIYSTEFWEL